MAARRGRPRKSPLPDVEPEPKRARRSPRRAANQGMVAPGPWGNFEVDEETKELHNRAEKAMLRQQLSNMENGLPPFAALGHQVHLGDECSMPATRLSHTDQLENHNLRFAECFKQIEDLCGRMGKLEAKVG